MSVTLTRGEHRAPLPAVALGEPERARLLRRAVEAARRARTRREPVVAAITVDAAAGTDPSAAVALARRDDEPWTVFEQADRAGRVLATLGVAVAIDAAGEDRFRTVADRWAQIVAAAVADPPGQIAGEGLVAAGGFAFDPDGAAGPSWDGFASASLHVPVLALAGAGGRTRATVAVAVGPGEDPSAAVDAVLERVAAVAGGPDVRPPLLDPDPVHRGRIVSALPPAHYEQAVAEGVRRIRGGEMDKVVLAREVQVVDRDTPDPAAILGVMREAYAGCCVLAVGRGERTFIAATPELLVRREASRVATLALAGTTRRSSDPAVETHLAEHLLRSEKDRGEHDIVVRRIVERLSDLALWTVAPDDPQVVQAASAQHLATPIRAQLAEPVGVVELVERLHPTPAVGGFPEAVALPAIPALEGLDRGWYAGPVGWTDAAGDGEFCVALRSALLEPRAAHCYAGVGVVADSDPAAELAETEVKLQALLPLLGP